jgi:hypothetical protein
MALEPHDSQQSSTLALGTTISKPLFHLAAATIGSVHRAAAPIPQMAWDMFVHTPAAVRILIVPLLLIFFLLYPLSYGIALSLVTLFVFLGASLFVMSTTISLTAVSLHNLFSLFRRGRMGK